MSTTATQTYTVITSITSLLTTQMNALASQTACAVGTEYDNATNLALWGDFQLDVTFASAPTVDTTVDLLLIPATDGTNYNDGGVGVVPQNFAVATWNMRAVNTQQLLSVWGIPLPPTKFKIIVFNNTNQAFPATGTTVKMIAYALKSVTP